MAAKAENGNMGRWGWILLVCLGLLGLGSGLYYSGVFPVQDSPETAVAGDPKPDVVEQEPAAIPEKTDAQASDTATDQPISPTPPTAKDTPAPGSQQEAQPGIKSVADETVEDSADGAVSDAAASEPVDDREETQSAVSETTRDEGIETSSKKVADTASEAPESADAQDQANEPSGAVFAPTLDVVRVAPDGEAVLAGKAAPGSSVTVYLDGEVLHEVVADGNGEFVGLLSLDPSDVPRVLTLQAALDGDTQTSEEQIILAPISIRPQTAEQDTTETATASEKVAALESASPEGGAEASVGQDVDPGSPAPKAEGAQNTPTTEGDEPDNSSAKDETADTSILPSTQNDVSTDQPDTEAVAQAVQDPQDAGEPASGAALTDGGAPAVATKTAEDTTGTTQKVAVLKATPEGVELLQGAGEDAENPAAGPAANQVVLETISYTDQGIVLLSGVASEGALVRIYLDNRAVAKIGVGANGRWSVELQDVAPGTYTLRLDELDAAGTVLSRVETPFRREAPERLAAASKASRAAINPGAAMPVVRMITVQKGDTLWALTHKRYGDGLLYVQMFDANRHAIRDPDLIYPGQVFTLPQ